MEPQIQILHTRGFAEILAIVRFRIVNSYPRFSGSMTRHNFKPCCDDKQFLAADAIETPADSSPPERNFALAVLRSVLAQPSRSVCLNCKVLVGIFAALMLCTGLEVCFGRRLDGERVLQRAWAILGSAESTAEQVARAAVDYGDALRALLPRMEKHSRDLATASLGKELSGYYHRDLFSEISPISPVP